MDANQVVVIFEVISSQQSAIIRYYIGGMKNFKQISCILTNFETEFPSLGLYIKWPEWEIVLCADDDTPGLAKARAVDGKVAIPDFGAQRPEEATDFNDLFIHRGPETVTNSIKRIREGFRVEIE